MGTLGGLTDIYFRVFLSFKAVASVDYISNLIIFLSGAGGECVVQKKFEQKSGGVQGIFFIKTIPLFLGGWGGGAVTTNLNK